MAREGAKDVAPSCTRSFSCSKDQESPQRAAPPKYNPTDTIIPFLVTYFFPVKVFCLLEALKKKLRILSEMMPLSLIFRQELSYQCIFADTRHLYGGI